MDRIQQIWMWGRKALKIGDQRKGRMRHRQIANGKKLRRVDQKEVTFHIRWGEGLCVCLICWICYVHREEAWKKKWKPMMVNPQAHNTTSPLLLHLYKKAQNAKIFLDRQLFINSPFTFEILIDHGLAPTCLPDPTNPSTLPFHF